MDGYFDKYGLLSKPGKGNAILYTAEWCLLANSPPPWWGILSNRIRHPCQVKPGLFRRHPEEESQIKWDDYKALLWSDEKIAKDIFWYGLFHFGFYKYGKPSHWYDPWLWRDPLFIAQVISFAFPWLRTPMWPLLKLSVALRKKDSQDSMIQNWFMCKALGWKAPYKIHAILSAYFNDPANPIVKGAEGQ